MENFDKSSETEMNRMIAEIHESVRTLPDRLKRIEDSVTGVHVELGELSGQLIRLEEKQLNCDERRHSMKVAIHGIQKEIEERFDRLRGEFETRLQAVEDRVVSRQGVGWAKVAAWIAGVGIAVGAIATMLAAWLDK